MKFQSISLPDKRPRDAMQLKKKIPLHRGLTPYYFFGVFTLTVPFVPAIILAVNGMISKIGWLPLVLLFLMAETFAFLYLNYANKNYLRRLRAFSNGLPVKAIIKGHSRNFLIWKSSKNYSIELSFIFQKKTINTKFDSSNSELHKQFPINSEILGLYDPDTESICFPPEIGLVLEEKQEILNPRKK
jgi:hypothetical protein